MSTPKAIEYITEYRLTWGEFNSIPEDQRAALSVASYAVSEINTLARLYMLSWQNVEGNEVVDQFIFQQSNVLLRLFSAKIFEFSQLVNLKDKDNKTSDEIVRGLFQDANREFDKLKARKGYKLAMFVRHEASSHYRLKPARENLASVSENARLSLCVHKHNANTVHPLGEESMFIGRLNRADKAANTKEEKIELHKEWYQWNLDATDWVNNTFEQLVQKVVLNRFPKKSARRNPHWVEPKLVAELEEVKIPVFLRLNRRKEGRNDAV
ncbi:hypothetical protein [Phaeobacter inhibens]|uniref:hypothetical protein n=1 Tax=Phaeobacter inhibens TaxID=221822 RepID=UPI0021A2BB03|nr:hypothetical protein [Phaeobacter inhibens]UWR58502.1 hypothetical protein K4F89_08740 [Phaeobacter inhibens]UWR63981.1 hypothetical protein K4L02_14710 [Phaeobacter inhibens]UWS03467.1 hypothetical protein K4K94_14330 [Phaeobacter inhibens]